MNISDEDFDEDAAITVTLHHARRAFDVSAKFFFDNLNTDYRTSFKHFIYMLRQNTEFNVATSIDIFGFNSPTIDNEIFIAFISSDNKQFEVHGLANGEFRIVENSFIISEDPKKHITEETLEPITLKRFYDRQQTLLLKAPIACRHFSGYATFIEQSIISKIKSKIDSSGKEDPIVINALETAQSDLEKVFDNESKDIIKLDNQVFKKINDALIRKIEDDILKRPEIKDQKRLVAFFKGLLGVLIAAVFLFFPLASKNFRKTFFASPQVKFMDRLVDELQKYGKENFR